MTDRPERVLAIDVSGSSVRGMILALGDPSTADGYAQLIFDPSSEHEQIAAVVTRIATALDARATLPVIVVCDDDLGSTMGDVVRIALTASGFGTVVADHRLEAARRVNPSGGPTDALIDVVIPSGLLTSHEGLTLEDLAAVAGAGVGVSRGGFDSGLVRPTAPATPDPDEIRWSRPASAEPRSDIDPFTSQPTSPSPASLLQPDDDLTIPAPDFDVIRAMIAKERAAVDEVTVASAGGAEGDDEVTVASAGGAEGDDEVTVASAGGAEGDDDVTVASSGGGAEGDDDVTVASSGGGVGGDDEVTVASATSDFESEGDDLTARSDEVRGAPDMASSGTPEMPRVAMVAAAAVDEDAMDDTVAIERSALRDATHESMPETRSIEPATGPPVVVRSTQRPRRRRWFLLAALAIAVAAAAITLIALSQDENGESATADVGAVSVAGEGSVPGEGRGAGSTTSAAGPVSAPDTLAPADEGSLAGEADANAGEGANGREPAVTAAAGPTPAATPTSQAPGVAAPSAEPTIDPLDGLPPLSMLPERGAIFRPPTLFLGGPVRSQAEADELYERAVAVVGPDNVVNNYIIRPDAPAAVDGNVRVEQAVLFQSGSAVIAAEFIPTLELGVAVMALNPRVRMVVEGHTDSVGSASANLALSQERAEAVVAYLVSRGVEASRLDAVGYGETTPVANNDTPAGRQVNRRIEVTLLDLLAPG